MSASSRRYGYFPPSEVNRQLTGPFTIFKCESVADAAIVDFAARKWGHFAVRYQDVFIIVRTGLARRILGLVMAHGKVRIVGAAPSFTDAVVLAHSTLDYEIDIGQWPPVVRPGREVSDCGAADKPQAEEAEAHAGEPESVG